MTSTRYIDIPNIRIPSLRSGHVSQMRFPLSRRRCEDLDWVCGGVDDAPATGEDVGLLWGEPYDETPSRGRFKIGPPQWLAYSREYPEDGSIAIGKGYGRPGDLLWVRENLTVCLEGFEYQADGELAAEIERDPERWNRYAHEDGPDLRPTTIPCIHMPRWASRLTLRLTHVRVERVQEIRSADAEAEGVERLAPCRWRDYREVIEDGHINPVASFATLWDSLNAKRGYDWRENPLAWVLTFNVIHANVDQVLADPERHEIVA